MDQTYCHNEAEIAVEQFDDGTVMINFLTGRYFALNPIAEALWGVLKAGASAEALVAALGAHSPFAAVERARLAADVEAFMNILVEERLLALAPGPIAAAAAPALGDTYEAPRVDVFDDLADLILLDPIHDVNEQLGWPVTREMAERE